MIVLGEGLLLVCGQRDFGVHLLALLAPEMQGSQAVTGAEARRKTSLVDYQAVLLAGRVPDENTVELAEGLAESGVKGVMIVVDRVDLADTHEALDGTGVTILSKPLTKEALTQSIKLVVRVSSGPAGIFEKAKLMLMQQKNWTEPQAHRYIQKLSMDKRMPRDVMSQAVIRALERERQAHEPEGRQENPA